MKIKENVKEEWKDVEGYEGIYKISNLGNLKSLDRYITRKDGVTLFKKGKLMTKKINLDGYCIYHLSKDGKESHVSAHRLVAEAFIPNPDKLPEVNHIDFNRENNTYINLEWVTHHDNVKHSIDAGRHFCNSNLFGENNPNYGNKTLHNKLKNNPELRTQYYARFGSQNGRSRKILMRDENGNEMHFNYIGECCEYLRQNKYTKSKTNTLRAAINEKIKNKGKYYGFTFEDYND